MTANEREARAARERAPSGVAPPAPAAGGGAGTRAPISSETLFGSASEVQIVHRGSIYRLKQTALGKLILTK